MEQPPSLTHITYPGTAFWEGSDWDSFRMIARSRQRACAVNHPPGIWLISYRVLSEGRTVALASPFRRTQCGPGEESASQRLVSAGLRSSVNGKPLRPIEI